MDGMAKALTLRRDYRLKQWVELFQEHNIRTSTRAWIFISLGINFMQSKQHHHMGSGKKLISTEYLIQHFSLYPSPQNRHNRTVAVAVSLFARIIQETSALSSFHHKCREKLSAVVPLPLPLLLLNKFVSEALRNVKQTYRWS